MAILRGFWRFLVGVKDALALLLLLMLVLAVVAARQGTTQITVPPNSALVLNLNGVIVDQARDPDPLTLLTGGSSLPPEIESEAIIKAIDAAAKDKRIKVITLDLEGFWGAGLANLQSIGEALLRFRATGKTVHAFATAYLDDSYYLASFADEVWINPLGAVLLTGPGGSNLYFKGALDKLAVDVNVFRVGTYKSAVEPFTLSEASPEARRANQALVDALWSTWLDDVSAQRGSADVRGYMSKLKPTLAAAGGNFARAALKAGLVDKIGTKAAFGEAMAKRVGRGDDDVSGHFNSIPYDDYRDVAAPSALGGGDKIGIVYVSGEIVDGEAPSGFAGGETISRLIEEALANDDLKALVVRVDSPGGSVTASEQIREALALAKAEGLPVVASFGPIAASGGYWVATAADEIFAQPSTITGSIGVFAILPTFDRSLDKLGINADGVRSTPFSGAPDIFDGLTPEVRDLMQASVEDIYDRFTHLVGNARKLPVERVDAIGQGRVWDGGTARQLKLVDRFGGLDAAVAAAARRAGLDPAKVRTVDIELTPPFPLQLLTSMFGADEGETAPTDALAKLAQAQQLRGFAALGQVAAITRGPTMQVHCISCVAFAKRPVAIPQAGTSWLTRLAGLTQ